MFTIQGTSNLSYAHAEHVAPHLLLQWHCHLAAIGKFVPIAAELLLVIAAQADGDIAAGIELHTGRSIGRHQA